jgi:sugar/nucleoside kinase (ribokinase family)
VGGPPTFVSLVANKLGARVGVVSKVGEDFRRHVTWLRENNVDLSHVQILNDACTTRFILTYNHGKRKLQLRRKAPQLVLQDIPTSLRTKAVHIAPVANELSPELIQELKGRASLLSLDPQGFLREFDAHGNVKPKKPGDLSFLHDCDVFKSSVKELKTMTGSVKIGASMRKIRNYGPKIILITMGRRGVLAHVDEAFYHIPACRPSILRDPTGAGDAFVGAFLAEYLRETEPLWCCCVGSAAASFVVEEVGPQRFGEKIEVYRRAKKIYEQGIKPLPQDAVA